MGSVIKTPFEDEGWPKRHGAFDIEIPKKERIKFVDSGRAIRIARAVSNAKAAHYNPPRDYHSTKVLYLQEGNASRGERGWGHGYSQRRLTGPERHGSANPGTFPG